jgi:glucosamine--fructose-6-phosphate aminotransferase (isomerizing)
MCGIVGYISNNSPASCENVAKILIKALEKLEYRGYDSAGIAILESNGEKKIHMIKTKGHIKDLCALAADKFSTLENCRAGIGHTRWATHGEPNDVNSHPHMSYSKEIALVHNGIIENYLELREFLTKHDYKFLSQTDTEVIAQLVEYYYKETHDPVKAVRTATNMLQGTYALAIIFAEHPDMLIALRKDSPLILGLCENRNMFASDVSAMLEYTRDIIRLSDYEMAIVKADSVTILNRFDEEVEKTPVKITWDANAAEKDGYDHFMMKEMMQQPTAVRNTISRYANGTRIDFGLKSITREYLKNVRDICIVACGSAYHAGVVGANLFEKALRIPTRAQIASEFIYSDPLINENTLTIVISQSGETLDSLQALRKAKELGSKTLSIVNVEGSIIAIESDDCIYTQAGPEIAVATTKAYSAQLVVLYMLLGHILSIRNDDASIESRYLSECMEIPAMLESILEHKEHIQHLASLYQNCESIFYIGRNLDYALALEGSLKLKEISYIHSEAYASGELKHGTISLIKPGTLVIASCTYEPLFEKTLSNITEVRSRGAEVIALAREGNTKLESVADHCVWLPKCSQMTGPSIAIVPMQLFAYYIAALRGCEIDKPRNLAKTVTVE